MYCNTNYVIFQYCINTSKIRKIGSLEPLYINGSETPQLKGAYSLTCTLGFVFLLYKFIFLKVEKVTSESVDVYGLVSAVTEGCV